DGGRTLSCTPSINQLGRRRALRIGQRAENAEPAPTLPGRSVLRISPSEWNERNRGRQPGGHAFPGRSCGITAGLDPVGPEARTGSAQFSAQFLAMAGTLATS